MATMLDVATMAGVSKATVSRVLSGKGNVAPDIKARVLRAIDATHYRPNLVARSLATQQSGAIGLVMTNSLYQGGYFSEFLSHLARLAEAKGRQIILADGKHSAAEERLAIDYLLDLRCDAVVIHPRFLQAEDLDGVIDAHAQPIIVLNRQLRKHTSHCVYTDQQQASFRAVSQLIALGHRDIGFITGHRHSPTSMERLSGYRGALAQARIGVNEALIVEGSWSASSGAAGAETLLAGGAHFSALVASNDEMAIGAIKTFQDRGIRVPGDVSVIGFDDSPIAPFIGPGLSSVKIPVQKMVEEAMQRLVFMIEGGELLPHQAFGGELVVRGSMGQGPV